jgi:hypothetical protein
MKNSSATRFLIVLVFLFIVVSDCAFAQDATTLVESGVDLNVMYRNEATFGILAHSEGFGLNYRRSKHVTAARKRVWEVELVNMGHPKEVKSVNPNFDNANGFYYGQLNALLIPRFGFGFQNVLFRKAERKSVEIRYSYYFGVSLGLAKPVYLEVLVDPNGSPQTARYNASLYNLSNIYGGASYFTGFDEMKIYPGGYGKVALSFEYGSLRNDVKVIEIGLTVDAYPQVIPQMAYAQNYNIFPSLYISLIYGKKWF